MRNEINNLKESIDHLKVENEDITKEVELQKEKSFSLEKQNIYLRNSVEEKDQKVEQVSKQLDRTKVLLKAHSEVNRDRNRFKELQVSESQQILQNENSIISDKENQDLNNSDNNMVEEAPTRQSRYHSRHNSVSSSYDLNSSYCRRNKSTFYGDDQPVQASQPIVIEDARRTLSSKGIFTHIFVIF